MKEYKRYLVTSALPYANGPVHIGHLAGVYVPADIYVRYLRMCGRDVFFVGGSDEHGVPITIQARKQGCSAARTSTGCPSPSRPASRAALPRISWTNTIN